jgi:hypothetical protein
MAEAAVHGERTDKGYELTVVVLLGLAFGFAFFHRQALTYLGPFVQKDLSLSNEQLGWANSGLSATWALGAFLIGRWSDRVGQRKPFLMIRGRADESVLDFYAQERRRVFVEVTSPMSTNFKRLLSEPDPARRAEDKAGMMAQAGHGHSDVRASSLAELIKGAPMPVEAIVA